MSTRTGRKGWICVALGLLLIAAIGGGLVQWTGLAIPVQFNPFGPPDLTAAPGFLTRIQLAALKRAPEQCHQALRDAGIAYSPAKEKPIGEDGCGLEWGVRFASTPKFLPQTEVSCPLAAAYVLFDRQVVAPAAEKHFEQPVTAAFNLGSYACRQIRNGGRLSEHATANAIDISGFLLADGRRVNLTDWSDRGAKGAFLREIAAGSCRLFNVVLGPEDDANHADHFHFDMGPFRRCRY